MVRPIRGHPQSLTAYFVILIAAFSFNLPKVSNHNLNSSETSREIDSGSTHPSSLHPQVIILSDGLEIKSLQLERNSIAAPLPLPKLARGGGERIVAVRTASTQSAQCDQNSTSLHLFWLHSKTWKLFHSKFDLSLSELVDIDPTPVNFSGISPTPISSVSRFDVTRNCASCGENVTYSLVIVDDVSNRIILLELDVHFRVINVQSITHAVNVGQISFTLSPQPSLTWIEDSSCIKKVSLTKATRPTGVHKIFCIEQFSSDAVVSAFHEGPDGKFTYVLSNRGDILRYPSSESFVSSAQLLISSSLYTKENIHEQHATTFNSIHVMENSTSGLTIFVSVKNTGVILRLEMDCVSSESHNSCQLTSSSTILAEHNLFDFQVVVSASSSCASWTSDYSDSSSAEEQVTFESTPSSATGRPASRPSAHLEDVTHLAPKSVNGTDNRHATVIESAPSPPHDRSYFTASWPRTLFIIFLCSLILLLSLVAAVLARHRSISRRRDRLNGSSSDSCDNEYLTSDDIEGYHGPAGDDSSDCTSALPVNSAKHLHSPGSLNVTLPRQDLKCNHVINVRRQGCDRGARENRSTPREQINRHSRSRAVESAEARREGLTMTLPIAIEDIGNGFANPSFSSHTDRNVSTGAPLKWKHANTLTRGHRFSSNVTSASTGAPCGDCAFKSDCKDMGICLNTYRLLNST